MVRESVGLCVDLDGPFRGSAAVAAGLVTPDRLRGPRFRRLFPDVYVRSELELDLRLRTQAAALCVGGRGVVVGLLRRGALGGVVRTGGRAGRGERPRRRGRPGLVVHRFRPLPEEMMTLDDVRLTTALRTADDLARHGPTAPRLWSRSTRLPGTASLSTSFESWPRFTSATTARAGSAGRSR